MQTKKSTIFKRTTFLLVSVLFFSFGALQSFAAIDFSKRDDNFYNQLNTEFYNTYKEYQEIDESKEDLKDFIIDPENLDNYSITVTYVNNGAGNNNSLYYFVIDKAIIKDSDEYATNISPQDIKLGAKPVFENIPGSVTHDKKELWNWGRKETIGPFKKGQKVGFYINSLQENQPFYSIRALNTDGSHIVAYKKNVPDIKNPENKNDFYAALGFEDRPRTLNGKTYSDRDFNDILFLVDVPGWNFGNLVTPEPSVTPIPTPTPTPTLTPIPALTDASPSPTAKSTVNPNTTLVPAAVIADSSTTPSPSLTPSITISNNNANNNTSGNLPKSGENSPYPFIFGGLIMVAVGLFIWFKVGMKRKD